MVAYPARLYKLRSLRRTRDMLKMVATGGRGEGCTAMRAERWLYWVTVGLSALALVLVVAYIVLVQDNRRVQVDVNRRQQFINQSMQLGRVNEALIRALAAAAVSNKDDKLRDLLADNGITINASGEPVPLEGGPAQAAPAPTGKVP